MEDLFKWNTTPLYWNYEVGQDRDYAKIDDHYPGYACTEESLQRYACDALEPEAE
jgi:amidase